MAQPTDHPPSEKSVSKKTMSRRKLLKLIGATSGAVAVSAFLPDSWLPPQVEIGVLPAHAQATGPGALTISALSLSIIPPNGLLQPLGISSTNPSFNSEFTIINGIIINGIIIQPILNCCPSSGYFKYQYAGGSITTNTSTVSVQINNGDVQWSNHSVVNSDTVFFDFCYNSMTNSFHNVCVQLEDTAYSRFSNVLCEIENGDDALVPPCIQYS